MLTAMAEKTNPPIDPDQAEARLKQSRKNNNTPAKVVAAHREVLLERVNQSMAFENQPVSPDRMKMLAASPKGKVS